MCYLFLCEDDELSNYELVYIVSPDVTDEELPDVLNKVSEAIGKIGGSVTEVAQWGRKKLAYPIKRFVEGNYVYAKLNIEPALTKELEVNLGHSDNILRHLLIRLQE